MSGKFCGGIALRVVVAMTITGLMAFAAMSAEAGPAAASSKQGFAWSSFLGPFHMVFLHFPIGFLTLTGAMELWAAFRPFEGARKLIGITLALGVSSAAFTAVLGLLRAYGGEYAPDVLSAHRNTGLVLTALAAVTWALHPAADRKGAGHWSYRGAMASTLGLLMIAGHQGGTLTHGRGFLTHNSPEPLRRLLDDLEAPSVPAVSDTGTYAAARKVLDAKCVSCHGPDKQKGKFRIDDYEMLIKGGSSGEPAIVPHDPAGSRLVRLILLPRDHDDVMPPDGKEQLSSEDTMAIIRWVQAGAPSK